MGLLNWLRPEPSANAQPAVLLTTPAGAQVSVTKAQWSDSILPATLKTHRNDPDKLYVVIVSALQEGFFAEVLEAAKHLSTIDPQAARGTVVYAIALMKTGQLDESERVLRACLDHHGENGTLLTNLAKIQAERNDHAAAENTLWHALEVDPNTDNAVVWYAALANDRGGKQAWMDTLRRIAALPGSWRAQTLLAATHLDAAELPHALALYREAIDHSPDPVSPDLFLAITGDLGKLGHSLQAVELAEPLFSLEVHGAHIANNLMLAHSALGNLDQARSILNQLCSHSRIEWKHVIDHWKERLAAN